MSGNAVVLIGAAGALLMAVAAFADERAPLDRTQPGHVGSRVHQPFEIAFPRVEHVLRYDDFIAYRFPGAKIDGASLDKRLSHLCRRGAFHPEKDWRLHAVTTGLAYAVAYGDGANLHDPQKLARSGMVYFFTVPDTSACEVFSVKRKQVQAFAQTRLGLEPAPAAPAGGPGKKQ
ncbi:MAG: hypothetical protein WCF85_14205 [Rhodospirillaceae bacterium]